MTDRVSSWLSLAARAGKIRSGEVSCEQTLRAGKAYLLIIAADASENTRKKFRNLAKMCRTPVLEYGDRALVGHMIGKEYRSTAAVTDEGLARQILKAADGAEAPGTDSRRENVWEKSE